MPDVRRTMRQLAESKNVRRQADLDRAVADGRLVIRPMSDRERDESDARWAAAAKARASRPKRGAQTRAREHLVTVGEGGIRASRTRAW